MRIALPLVFAALAGCAYPATEVIVVIGTDVDPSLAMTVTATVSSNSDPSSTTTHGWHRAIATGVGFDAGATDGGIMVPASFAIVPGSGGSSDAVTLVVVGDAAGVMLRRTAVFQFTQNVTTVLPIYLTSACEAAATGCTSTSACTVQQHCEDQGQTCGNDGTCVNVYVTPGTDLDASFGDIPSVGACGSYHHACCVVGPACASPLSCVTGRCQRCTDPGELCCTGPDLLADGTQCESAPDACHTAATCTAGVCGTSVAQPDGTVCAMASSSCQLSGTCTGGVCSSVTNVADGTVCASTSNPCQQNGTCTAGACSGTTSAPDGAVCATGSGACQQNGTCTGGVCSGVIDLPDGTVCATTSNACQHDAVCVGGACGGFPNVANGTVCATTTNPCKHDAVCTGGTCGAFTNVANGTVCAAAANHCEIAGTCSAGTCGAITHQPNGHVWGTGDQICCGGAEETADRSPNCGVCGLACAAGRTCTTYAGHHFCSCMANSQCFSSCCRTATPGADLCAPGNCSTGICNGDCPGGSSCSQQSGAPNYCYYP